MQIIFHYDPNSNHIVNDFNAQELEREILSTYERFSGMDNSNITLVRTYNTTLPFTIVRALIAEGRIDHNDVQFVYNEADFDFSPNEFGAYSDYPDEMDIESRYCERILRGAVAKRKSKV